MRIKWRTVFAIFLIIVLLANLKLVVGTLARVIANVFATVAGALGPLARIGYSGDRVFYDWALLFALIIIFVFVFKVLAGGRDSKD